MKVNQLQVYILFYIIFNTFQLSAQTGIGTTTPVNKLQVETTTADPANSGATANGNFRLSGTNGSHVLDFGLSSSSTYSWLQSRSKSAYGTNFDLLLNPNGGNIGIGAISPGDRLVVGSSIALHDGGDKVIGLGWSPGSSKALLSGFPAELRLEPSSGRLSFGTSATSFTTGGTVTIQQRMTITSQGNVGIGTSTPTVRLQVAGDIIANSIAGSSDSRFKTNIIPIENSLQKVMQMRGVTFDWKTKEFPSRTFSEKRSMGFIAQEVEQVVPEVVQSENTTEGYKSVQYDKIVALLVEAIKEQQKQIEQLQQKVKELTEKKGNEK
ncbi:MAG: tail fiber domain-containing protein [Bacteroidia bacterium]|nr:tail fiber domain-containing protein [Bacteroidia bacterium]